MTLYDEAYEGGCIQEPLALENTLWANTVLASGIACGIVVHTGTDTRSSMNSSAKPPSKMATLDLQVNSIAKLPFLLVTVFALAMVVVPIVQSWAFNNSLPAFSTALAFYDGFRCKRLPANLLQAQRDYFGAHTFERLDAPGTWEHANWTGNTGRVTASTYLA